MLTIIKFKSILRNILVNKEMRYNILCERDKVGVSTHYSEIKRIITQGSRSWELCLRKTDRRWVNQ